MNKLKSFELIKYNWMMFLIVFFWVINPFPANSQVIAEPKAKATTTDQAYIEEIEITETNTIFHMLVTSRSSSSFLITSKTYIVNSDGGEPLYIESAEGVTLDKIYTETKKDLTEITLFFPRIGSNVKSINYRSGEGGSYWHFFDISVSSDIGKDLSVKSGKKGRDGNCIFIENPGYTASSGGFNITKIELCDTATILYFSVVVRGSIWVPSKSSIRDSNGGDNLFVTAAEGTNMDKEIKASTLEDGILKYKLFFPPINDSIKKIDFREVNDGGSWFIYELDVDTEGL